MLEERGEQGRPAKDKKRRERKECWRVFVSGVLQVVGWAVALLGGAYAVRAGKDAATTGVVTGTGLAMVLLAQLDKFESLKGGGIEVKVRRVQKAKREVEQALAEAKAARDDVEVIRRNIRDVARGLGIATLRLIAGEGTWVDGQMSPKIGTRDVVRTLLEQAGETPEEVDSLVASFDKFVRVTLATSLKDAMAKAAESRGEHDLAQRIKATGEAPRAETLAALMSTHGLSGENAESTLAALRQFEATGTVPEGFSV